MAGEPLMKTTVTLLPVLLMLSALLPTVVNAQSSQLRQFQLTQSQPPQSQLPEVETEEWGNDRNEDRNEDWDEEWDEEWNDDNNTSPWQPLTGFFELAQGGRVSSTHLSPHRSTLQEGRLRLATDYYGKEIQLKLKADLVVDGVTHEATASLRQAVMNTTIGENIDLQAGHQVLTWGTGDYLFLNDLFAKDWQSFFSGRDDPYLKAASTALKATWFGQLPGSLFDHQPVGFDVVFQPRFQADNYLTGERFSFFDGNSDVVAPQPPLSASEPHQPAWSARLFFNLRQAEFALYGYRGFYGNPSQSPHQPEPNLIFPRLSAFGASVRAPLGPGLINVEFSQHHSGDNPQGQIQGFPVSQRLYLVGYEQEIASKLTLGGQFYTEAPRHERPKRRLWTVRLNYRMWQDKLQLGLFGFYSPTDKDHYLRPTLSYRHDDHWRLSAGANLFNGHHNDTFFGQLENNSNAYLRLSYSF